MNSRPASDEELASRQWVARHLHGDPDAFAELVKLFSGRVFNLAVRFTGDRAEAEDITQESFLRAYAALPRSRADLPFRPWLLQIAVNLCRDWARRASRRPVAFSDMAAREAGELDGNEAPAGIEAGAEAVPDAEPAPPEAAELKEQLADLRQAVLALPPALRMIVTLRYNEDLSYEEIGRLLNMPPGTVGTSLLRARRRLRAALAERGEATDDQAP